MSRFDRGRGSDDEDDERDSRSGRFGNERAGGAERLDEFGRVIPEDRLQAEQSSRGGGGRDDRDRDRERERDRERGRDRERDRERREPEPNRRKRGRDEYDGGGRDDHRGGGGGRDDNRGGGGGGRRDENRGGGGGGGYDGPYGGSYGGGYKHRRHDEGEYRQPPRHRSPPRSEASGEVKSIDQMLTELLLEIGNPSDGPLEGNLHELSNVLKQDLDDNLTLIIQLILDCVVELPAQTPVYGALAGLLNAASESFGKAIVDKCGELLQAALDSDQVLQSRLLVRFLAELLNANALHPDSLLSLFNSFVEHAIEAGAEAGAPKQQADFLVALVLEAMIWVGRTLNECRNRETSKLLGRINAYMTGPARTTDFSLVRVFAETAEEKDSSDLFKPTDFLGALHKVVTAQKENGWRCDATLKPYQSFEAQLGDATQHRVSSVTPPGLFNPASYRLRMVYRIFDADIDDMRPVDRLVCETHLIDTMQIFDFDHEERDEQTGGLLVSVKEAAWRLVGGIDRRRIVPVLPPMMPKEQLDKLICETIFSQMFQLPSSPMPTLYYSTLLSNLVKLDKHRAPAPEPFAAMLVFTIECIFEQLDGMDVQCKDTFATWFAHHLSNQAPAWKWEWEKWAEVLEMPKSAPRRLWVQDVLDRSTRLSFHENIRLALVGPAEPFQTLMPPPVETPAFKYSDGTDELAAAPFAFDLHEKMLGGPSQKQPPKEVVAWLKDEILPSLSGVDAKGLALDAAIHCCLQAGTDPTHLTAIITRFMPVLEHLGALDRANTPRVLSAVTEFWATSNQQLILTVLRLLSMRIVPSPAALISFVFDDSNREHLESSHWWEIIRLTLAKTVSRSKQVQSDLTDAKAVLADAPEVAEEDDESDDMKESDDDAESGEDVAPNRRNSESSAGKVVSLTGSSAVSRASLEAKVEKIEDVQDTVLAEQKEMLLILFQRIVILLSNHFARCEAESVEVNTTWLARTLGHFKEIARLYRSEISSFMSTLDTVVFSASSVDERLTSVFAQIKEAPFLVH